MLRPTQKHPTQMLTALQALKATGAEEHPCEITVKDAIKKSCCSAYRKLLFLHRNVIFNKYLGSMLQVAKSM